MMSDSGLFGKAKDVIGGAAGGLKEGAEKLAETAADKIDEATEKTGGVAKQVGDVIGSNKEKIGDAASGLMDKLGKSD